MAAPCAVLLPGAGSNADFLGRAFGGPLAAVGLECVAVDLPCGELDRSGELLADTVRRTRARVVGGISRGAHLAATWAARRGDVALDGLLLALPAWTGDGRDTPGRLASSLAAQALRERGRSAVLAESRGAGVPWLAEELARAWLACPEEELLADLTAAVTTPAPELPALRGIAVPSGVVGFARDAFHPLPVAREWAGALPRAALEVLDVTAPEHDRTVLGAAAVAAWQRACAASPA
jgi:pimeloyl-ACP methyl ester carboxylesterase